MEKQDKAGGADQAGPANAIKARPAIPEEEKRDAEGHGWRWGATPEDEQPGPDDGLSSRHLTTDKQDVEGQTLRYRPAIPDEQEADAEGQSIRFRPATPEGDEPGPDEVVGRNHYVGRNH
jgi:hypothetical protein